MTRDDVASLLALIDARRDTDWLPGRQGTGYEKLPLGDALPETLQPLLSRSLAALGVEVIAWDCYLLRYLTGTFVPVHVDPTDHHRHLRLNAMVQASAGGELVIDGEVVALAAGDAVVFRPDVSEHEVRAGQGVRYVWSVGCLF